VAAPKPQSVPTPRLAAPVPLDRHAMPPARKPRLARTLGAHECVQVRIIKKILGDRAGLEGTALDLEDTDAVTPV
jgi:hypothetical protein